MFNIHLRLSSQVDDGVEGDVVFELIQDPGVIVLVHAPLRLRQATALKQVGGKHVPVNTARVTCCSARQVCGGPAPCLRLPVRVNGAFEELNGALGLLEFG